jgi:hypothetical protein
MVYFVSKGAEICGPEFLFYNVHSLVHLSKEVERYGTPDNTSAFIFENYMQKLKRCVRNARNPVVQVAKRLHEESLLMKYEAEVADDACITELCKFSCKPQNNCGVTADRQCCQVISNDK